MYRYSGFALTIDSELELPDLPPSHATPDIAIRLGSVARELWPATLEEEITFNTIAGGFHLRNGNEILVDPIAGVDPGTLRLVLLGRIMAFLLRQRGWLSLHASGVLVDGKGVLFVGASGVGKSTTAAAFHAQGHRVITDDVGAVRTADGECLVLPAWPRLRLMDDSRKLLAGRERRARFQIDKHTVDLEHPELAGALPVQRIYLLEYGTGLGLIPVPALEAVALLSMNSFIKRRRMTPDALASHLKDCAKVAGTVQVYRLVRPQSMAALPEVVRLVEDGV
jgi:hypothetical protein